MPTEKQLAVAGAVATGVAALAGRSRRNPPPERVRVLRGRG